jgi:hypothetical protein
MEPVTVTPYLKSCILPRNSDSVNVMYLASRNPVEKVIGKTIRKAAM